MSASNWVHIHVVKIVKETDAAFLLDLGDDYDDQFWIPKSQIANADDYDEGDQDFTISVSEFIAQQKGIEEGD